MRKAFVLGLVLFAAIPAVAATKLSVTVIDKRSGEPMTELKASDFTVVVDKTPKRVESAEFKTGVIDIVLLLDSSQIGGVITPDWRSDHPAGAELHRPARRGGADVDRRL
jgi:hypothetical protein